MDDQSLKKKKMPSNHIFTYQILSFFFLITHSVAEDMYTPVIGVNWWRTF